MELIPIKTRVMQPPQDDLWAVLDESLTDLKEKDIVVVTSKVVAISEGRCVPIATIEKKELIKQEADVYLEPTPESPWNITLIHNSLQLAAGIDESNANGHYILLPKHPYQSAREIWQYLRKQHQIKDLGVIITDSHSLPLRYGTMSISIGFWGIKPIHHYEGTADLFGRPFQFERFNVIDSIAAAAGVVMGEGTECTPLAVVRGLQRVEFSDLSLEKHLLIPPKEDIYYPLLRALFSEETLETKLALKSEKRT